MTRRAPSKWVLLAVSFAALVALDQWTKYLAVERLTFAFEHAGAGATAERVRAFYGQRHLERLAREPFVVWKPVWRMNYVENPGAAWGLFRGLSEGVRNAFFTAISLGAVVFILLYYRKLEERQRYLQISLSLVLSGAVGNFIDRIARQYVIDFIEWHWWNRPDIRWPTFNIADSLIVVGVALLVLHPGPKRDESAAAAGNERGAPGV